MPHPVFQEKYEKKFGNLKKSRENQKIWKKSVKSL